MEKEELFRKKNLKKATDAEELNRGIKLTGYDPWIVVIAGLLLLAAIILGGAIADIRDVVKGAGSCQNGTFTAYFREEDISSLQEGMDVSINGATFKLDKIEQKLFTPEDLPNDILYFSPKGSWYQTAQVTCDLEDGIYRVEVPLGNIKPLSFMSGGR